MTDKLTDARLRDVALYLRSGETMAELDASSAIDELIAARAEIERLRSAVLQATLFHAPQPVLFDKIKGLEAEIERLAANACHGGGGDERGNHVCAYQSEIARLTAERDALAEDKARLNHLLSIQGRVIPTTSGNGYRVVYPYGIDPVVENCRGFGKTQRAAIDVDMSEAAIDAARKGEG